MKNAPITNSNESAHDKRNYNPGTLPKRINTVTAAVLAGLLESKELNGLGSVFSMSTTRLAAYIHTLSNKYEWEIERKDKCIGTNDGRIAWITEYWLPVETISLALDSGARDWIDGVKNASATRRLKPAQGSLWSEA